MYRTGSSWAFLIAGSFLTSAAVGQMGAMSETASLLASPTLSPEGRKAMQERIDAVHARFRERHGGLGPEQFGVECCQITQIPAAAFSPSSSELGWGVTFGYVSKTASSGNSVWAPVQLPSGVEIEYLDLYHYDLDPTNHISTDLLAYSGGAPDSGSPDVEFVTSVTSTGSSGYGYAISGQFPLGYTVNNNVAFDPAAAQLVVRVSSPIATSDLGFKAVDLWWMRQVGPAPAVPTFDDVPANDPAFQFVEALAASGITVGCSVSPPLYCPDGPLTRRQMAVFLSKSLGLYWPY